MKVLFLGDIVGRSGREALNRHLHKINLDNQIDFTIVNGENAAGGFGITEKICGELYNAGANAITTGNHLWDQKEISSYIDKDHRLLKPYNSAEGTPGVGYNKNYHYDWNLQIKPPPYFPDLQSTDNSVILKMASYGEAGSQD